MKLIIAGSRHLRVNFSFIESKFTFFEIPKDQVSEIIHGDAKGIDFSAKSFALKSRIKETAFPYPSEKGRAGGPLRNKEMLRYCIQSKEPFALMLIWDSNSKGSANMKYQARQAGIPIFEIILNKPTQADMKRLQIYKKPEDRVSEVNKSNVKKENEGAMV